jgi:flagellar basal body-associated protein FliL
MKAKMSKKSTLTITIMACLLAVAVATTIVLAAFTANKQATTTITFASGVKISIMNATSTPVGLHDNSTNAADTPTSGPATLFWAYTANGTTYTNPTDATDVKVSTDVTLAPLSFKNGSQSDGSSACYMIAKVEITPATSQFSKTIGSGWIAIGETGWYAYSTDTTNITSSSTSLAAGTTLTSIALEQTVAFVTAASITLDNDLAGASVTPTVSVYAVNAAASDAITALNAAMA